MGFSFKKLARGVRKVAKKNRGGFGRLVKKVGPGLVLNTVLPGSGIVAKAASVAKTLGKKRKGLETAKSLVPVLKNVSIRVGRKRTKMPGGAPMPPNIGTPSVGMMSSGPRAPKAKRKLYEAVKSTRRRVGKAPGISTAKTKPFKTGKARTVKAPSAAQLAAREKFKQMVAARRKAKKAA